MSMIPGGSSSRDPPWMELNRLMGNEESPRTMLPKAVCGAEMGTVSPARFSRIEKMDQASP
jgi:hypothetical protein